MTAPNILLHMDGTNGSTSFPDATGAHTVTAYGNAAVSTAQSQFSGASLLVDGGTPGDYLEVPNSSDWELGSNPFTVECWIHPIAAMSSYGAFVTHNGYSSNTGWGCGCYLRTNSDSFLTGSKYIPQQMVLSHVMHGSMLLQ